MAKIFCTCKNKETGYTNLTVYKDKNFKPIFVHAECMKPSKEVWEGSIKTCECFSKFSSPWESRCKDCFLEEFPNGEYKSWAWGRRYHKLDMYGLLVRPSGLPEPALVLTLPAPGRLGDVESRPNAGESRPPLTIDF